MKHPRFAIALFFLVAAIHFSSQGEILTDLPDPSNPEASNQTEPSLPAPPAPPMNPEASNRLSWGQIKLSNMARTSGGTLYQIQLKKPAVLVRLNVQILISKLKIHNAQVVTESGRKIEIQNYRNTEVLETGLEISSESLSSSEKISSVEILAEAYGGLAEIMINGLGLHGAPEFSLASEAPTDRRANYTRRLQVGDQVVVLERDYALARVTGISRNGGHVIRFLTGPLAGQSGDGWTKPQLALVGACSESLCTEDVVYNLEREFVRVRIAAVSADGAHVVRFLEGPLANQFGHGWSADSLSTLESCGRHRCVGQKYYLHDGQRDSEMVEVVGVDRQKAYVVRFLSGVLRGRNGGGWSDSNLASMSGCGAKYCVGDIARAQQSRVKVIGVQLDKKYIITFLDGPLAGRNGSGWSEQDLQMRGVR